MPRAQLNPHPLLWVGEHWVNYLRVPAAGAANPEGAPVLDPAAPGDARDFGLVSLYHTRYCPAGEGNAALVIIRIPGQRPFEALCSDNPDLGPWILEHFVRGKTPQFERPLEPVLATFTRGGDLRDRPTWTLQTPEHRVVATWSKLASPVIAHGPAPAFRRDMDFFSILFFADAARIEFDGQAVPGRPYLRDIWRQSIGGDRSSCAVAICESICVPPPAAPVSAGESPAR